MERFETGVSRVTELENLLGEILDRYDQAEMMSCEEETDDLFERVRTCLASEVDGEDED